MGRHGRRGKKRASHPKKPKEYESPETYRRFRAYIHMRTPRGKRARTPKQTISGRTPRHRKEKVVMIRGKKHRPKLS